MDGVLIERIPPNYKLDINVEVIEPFFVLIRLWLASSLSWLGPALSHRRLSLPRSS